MIKITSQEWQRISEDIKQTHGATTLLLRDRMRQNLGFTVRWGNYTSYPDQEVFLDFFDEAAETHFRLKYQ